MKSIRFIIIVLSTFMITPVRAQDTTDGWEEIMQQLTEELMDDNTDEELLEAQTELLLELHENPIDLNHADRQHLLRLPFLSERAVDGLLDYLSLNGPMRSLGELRFVPELGYRERQWLSLFVVVGDEPIARKGRDTTWWGRDRHELLARVDVPMYRRAGWAYGRGIAQRWRYTWQQGQHIDVGIRGENDAGEPIFCHDNRLWDSYGGHAMLHDVGFLQTLIVGDYKAGFGEGLVVNNNFRLGKMISSFWRTPQGIRPHRSAEEINFMRGVAATIGLGRAVSITAFYSRRRLDATVHADNTISTLSRTGLHRTANELAHKGSVVGQTSGLHVGATHEVNDLRMSLGATALYQYYDHQFSQGSTLYRQIYPVGYQFGAASIDYSLRTPRLSVSGETAHNFQQGGGAWSTLNKVAWRFSADMQLAAIQRFYAKRYGSPYASAFGENNRVQNESGVAVSFEANRLGPCALRAFFDYFYSPWPRMTMTRSSRGWESNVQWTYQLPKQSTFLLRYAVKSKERSDHRYFSHRLRTSYTLPLSSRLAVVASAFVHHFHEKSGSTGYALAPRIDYSTTDEKVRISVVGSVFHANDFDARLFVYEPALYQSFGLQQLYGRGQRLAVLVRYRSGNRRWMLQSKLGMTHFSDRDAISDGILRIDSAWKTDLQLLFKLRI